MPLNIVVNQKRYNSSLVRDSLQKMLLTPQLGRYMQKMKLIALLLLMSLSTLVQGQELCPLNGIWKSNERMTLDSMNTHGKVTEKQRELFENSFFGNLEIEVSCNQFTSTYEDAVWTVEYQIVEVSGNRVTTRYHDSLTNEVVEMTIIIENDCYSLPIGSLGFREYFCRDK